MAARRSDISLVCLLALALIAPAARAELPNYGYKVVHVYPHDPHAYTEGLFYLGGFLYESTGQIGESTIRKVRIEDGEIKHEFPAYSVTVLRFKPWR